jgi:signal transduction histidine kinase
MKLYFWSLLLFLNFQQNGPNDKNVSIVNEINSFYLSGQNLISTDSKESLHQLNKGLMLSKDLNAPLLIALGNLHLSEYYLSENNFTESINAVNKALKIYKTLKDKKALSNCNSRLGDIYFKNSNFDKSHYYHFEALRLNEQLNDELGVAKSLRKIGGILTITPDPEIDLPKAMVNYKKALAIYEKIEDEKGIMSCLSNIGSINLKEGINQSKQEKIIKAIDLFKEALSKAEKLNDTISQGMLLGNIGPSLRVLNRNDESLSYLFRSLKMKVARKDSTSAAHSCNDITETYMALNDLKNAKKYALKAVDYSRGVSLNQERYAFYLLSEINSSLGDHKTANNDLKLFYQLADSIFSLKKLASIDENQVKYETEKKSFIIKAQESDIDLLNEKNKVKNQFIAFGSIGILAFFGLILLVRSRNKAKENQVIQEQFSQQLLRTQEDERTRIANDLHDSVGQKLNFISRKSQNLKQDEISDLTTKVIDEVRSISRGLYPVLLTQFGLTESIKQLVLDYDEETDLFFTSEIDSIDESIDKNESLNLYRFVQESINNIIKHADAKAVSISIEKVSNTIIVSINDNGKGFDTNDGQKLNSLGLKTLKERIRILNGKLIIKSKQNKGTSIIAKFPVK